MRTTLTLDGDVAAQLEAWCAKEDLTLKGAVNSALRRGLGDLDRPKVRKPFRTRPVDRGRCLVASLDNVWDVLDGLENEEWLSK